MPIPNTIIKIECYKICSNLDLKALASYFDVPYNEKYPNHILLSGKAISSIIKVRSNSKFLFMYEFGCIVFVDFSLDQIHSAFGFLETITDVMDYKLIHQFNENLTLTVNDNQVLLRINDFPCMLDYNENILHIACGLISKSTSLLVTEAQITTVLDDAENIVNYLQKAKLRINTKKFVSSISHMARFQYNAIKSFSTFKRNSTLYRNTNSKSFYSILCHYYEIDDRNSILESKIDQINRLISSHTTLSYNREEMRLLLFECVLLAMFSLPHLVDFKAFFR